MNRSLLLVMVVFGGCADLEEANPVPDSAQDREIVRADGLPEDDRGAQAASLQERVDDVLASIPGGHQVSATQIDYDGLIVTFEPNYSPETAAFASASVTCSDGWFCIVVRGTTFRFFTCRMWNLSNWLGNAPFNNNQTPGTVARAYNRDLTREVWNNTAKKSGTVDVTPWWHFQPCGGPDLPGP